MTYSASGRGRSARSRRGDLDLGRIPRWEWLRHRRPAWLDGTLARRILAAALTVLAAFLLLRGNPAAQRVEVVVAAHDLPPGRAVAAADLRIAAFTANSLPGGAIHEPAPLLGATLSAPMRAGEIFTDLRVLGPRLAAAATAAPDARIVPIRLADNAVAEILRTGDRVDVVAAAEPDTPTATPARTLASGAVVVSIPERSDTGKSPRSEDRVVLIALDSAHATTVAAASLRTALTVIFQ
ncbi:flagellar biosynthesis protein FlgA [Nocardia sp. CA2R105]|uniref:SAF domain-containing protein n=1 Tax=Nocardia coffeae TaxID=2873381 RepID=UPI001CA72158|nr:SAF domain-containing protein [Nocardia coffeae]MBY8857894.1 flagellar biosynthesis protein FlgA [Nocardia coffeae]